MGEPMGKWNKGKEQSKNLYLYESCMDADRLYAFREIAQLPVACKVPLGAVFQNTVYLVQLAEPFPLDAWCMSRLVQFYAAKVMRSTVIEDLSAHWYKRQIALLPIPAARPESLVTELIQAGQRIIEADRDIANRYRRFDELAAIDARTLLVAFQKSDPLCAGIGFSAVSDEDTPLAGVRDDTDAIITDDLIFRLVIPSPALRKYLLFVLQRRLLADESASLNKTDILNISVPTHLDTLLSEIDDIRGQDVTSNFENSLTSLDVIVGASLGLTETQIAYVQEQMRNDVFLKQISILWEHRGRRVQAYSDSEGKDRYD